MATLLNGIEIARKIRTELAEQVRQLPYIPQLSVLLLGDDPASEIYVRRKTEACKSVGITSEVHEIPATVLQDELEHQISVLGCLEWVDGILLQLPLPSHIDRMKAFDLINPEKDVDVLNPINVGLLMQGRPRFLPCTPQGINLMLERSGISVAGKHVVVINRSDIVGKPLSSMLIQNEPEFGNATVTVCHDHTPAEMLKQLCLAADMIVVAVGIPGFLTPDMVKPGQIVIDVGITRVDKKIVGDVAPGVADKVAWISPVPGGVGPMTITSLLFNTVRAATLRRK